MYALLCIMAKFIYTGCRISISCKMYVDVSMLPYVHDNCVHVQNDSAVVLHETKPFAQEVRGQLVSLILATLLRAIESISVFCLPSRIRHGAGDGDLYPVIVFVVSI